jgi:prolyl-tRNA synthetase
LRGAGVAVRVDDRAQLSPGFKFNEWELAGVPLRLELGPKDLEKGSLMAVKRPNRAKSPVALSALEQAVPELLNEVQAEMLAAARARRDAATLSVDDYARFREVLDGPGGFLLSHWCGDRECETAIHEETKATIRCLAFDSPQESGACVRCARPSERRVHFAKAY